MKRSWLLICLLAFLSCKKSSTDPVTSNELTVRVLFDNFSGKSPVDRNYAISTVRLYLSHFELLNTHGNATEIKDLMLANSTNTDAQNSFTFTLPADTFTQLRFHFGLDRSTNNDGDPATFAPSHPLSLNQDMFWGMMRYRFIVAEGNVDSSAAKDQAPSSPFSMHLGTDTLYRQFNSGAFTSSTPKQIDIHIDLHSLFLHDQSSFDITNFSNHSSPGEIPKAITITDSLMNNITTMVTYY
jgi:hypothetical protein